MGFSLSAWREFEIKIKQRSRFDPGIRQFETYYIARAALCGWDYKWSHKTSLNIYVIMQGLKKILYLLQHFMDLGFGEKKFGI